jgi:hypothetical protein
MSLESITGNQGRDFKIESGTASARRPSEEDDAVTPQNVSGRQEKNRSRTTGTLGENQGREEVGNSMIYPVRSKISLTLSCVA